MELKTRKNKIHNIPYFVCIYLICTWSKLPSLLKLSQQIISVDLCFYMTVLFTTNLKTFPFLNAPCLNLIVLHIRQCNIIRIPCHITNVNNVIVTLRVIGWETKCMTTPHNERTFYTLHIVLCYNLFPGEMSGYILHGCHVVSKTEIIILGDN